MVRSFYAYSVDITFETQQDFLLQIMQRVVISVLHNLIMFELAKTESLPEYIVLAPNFALLHSSLR